MGVCVQEGNLEVNAADSFQIRIGLAFFDESAFYTYPYFSKEMKSPFKLTNQHFALQTFQKQNNRIFQKQDQFLPVDESFYKKTCQ